MDGEAFLHGMLDDLDAAPPAQGRMSRYVPMPSGNSTWLTSATSSWKRPVTGSQANVRRGIPVVGSLFWCRTRQA